MSVEVSVIIPTFRRPRELVQALASVLGQAGVSVEVTVVDDSPEASARAAVAGVGDARVRYLHNPRPSGGVPSAVRNLGLPHATGEFVHFLDDDDVVTEGHYAAATAAFIAHPAVGLVFGRIEPFGSGPEDQLVRERAYFAVAAARAAACARFGPKWAFVGRMLFGDALLVCSASLVRRRCLQALGGFDPEIRLMEDADFHLRAMRACGAVFLDRPAVRYRIGAASLMHAPNPPPSQAREELAGRRRMQAKYREAHGAAEFYALALWTRTVLRVI